MAAVRITDILALLDTVRQPGRVMDSLVPTGVWPLCQGSVSILLKKIRFHPLKDFSEKSFEMCFEESKTERCGDIKWKIYESAAEETTSLGSPWSMKCADVVKMFSSDVCCRSLKYP